MNNIIYVGKHALMWSVSRHIHPGWELIYCTSGGGEMVFADRTLPYSAHDVAVIPPMLPHSNQSKEGFTNLHMNLTDAALPSEPLIIRADSNGHLLNAFQAAFYYYSEAAVGRTLLPIYGELITSFLTAYQPFRRHSEVVQQIEDSILQHYPDCTYDLNAYLASLPFNLEYLKKMFKRETGLTPLQYLTDKRLQSAARTLSTYFGKGNVSETAQMCGFADPLYFSRLFKKKYGVSPRNYSGEGTLPEIIDSDSIKIMV